MGILARNRLKQFFITTLIAFTLPLFQVTAAQPSSASSKELMINSLMMKANSETVYLSVLKDCPKVGDKLIELIYKDNKLYCKSNKKEIKTAALHNFSPVPPSLKINSNSKLTADFVCDEAVSGCDD